MSNEKDTLQTEEKVVENKSANKVVEVKAKNVAKKKKDKVKKPSKVGKALKDTGAELKKVSWPKFKDVVKQTSVVLVVVLVFTLVIFGVDRLCSWLTGLLF
ncbi:MAG: preprotein translocase subunit SecE [Clostridia bacterium]|nr:preprotein translocase subunit SecE [Clostridia bacterium]